MIPRRKKQESGQTMIEFLLVIMLVLTLVFGFMQLAWALAWGHYVQYSTYMAARAYFSARATKGEQLESATNVLRAMVKNQAGNRELVGSIVKARTGDNRNVKGAEPVPGAFIGAHPFADATGMTERAYSWAEGVQYNWQFKLFIIPLASFLRKDEGKTIQIGPQGEGETLRWDGMIGLTSDAWLGREVSVEECQIFMQQLSRRYPRGDTQDFLEDNGC